MFTVCHEEIGKLSIVRLQNTDSGEFVTIIPEFGGNVNEIVLSKEFKLHSLLDGFLSRAQFEEQRGFKGAKLLPFPNRIKGGQYIFNGRQFQLPVNREKEGNAIHGFLFTRNMPVVDEQTDNQKASVQLNYDYSAEMPGYPFSFKVNLEYSLFSREGFRCTTTVQNTGKEALPFGDGWHPYFRISRRVNELTLLIPSQWKVDVDKEMIPTGMKEFFPSFLDGAPVRDHQFDCGFYVGDQKMIAETELSDPVDNLHIRLWQETGRNKYNFLQVFTPASRESIALEPMTCATNAFNNGEGLIVLEPGETFGASYGVRLT